MEGRAMGIKNINDGFIIIRIPEFRIGKDFAFKALNKNGRIY